MDEIKRRILVVEDEQDVAYMIARFLGNEYDVVVAMNGQQGLDMAFVDPKPDLIITDVMMPKLDGITMVKRIRERDPNRKTPVIFLTAKSAPMDIVAGIQAGAKHYITKPFQFDELRKKVRKVLTGK
ncbi:two component transcriptional regulator, winged helix family [Chondromyces apiculatus DSM 436]|uniref:Two component transcriptional regulator, winged helix family n=1 Tax=Chondromyces apiculatus DSM 436 TaxID=1192034 RepID=A0A017THJ9_9BACT|nr:two component transcriptional regulator, winged helix family [Chondromyces apiculatus DSM 436]